LPEAQLDRFLLKVTMPLPERETELRVLAAHAAGFDPHDLTAAGISPVAGVADLTAASESIRRVYIAPEVLAYVVELARATRSAPSTALGVSPRGATALVATARAWAWLSRREFVTPDDIQALARPTFRHRISLRPEAEIEGVAVDGLLDSILASVPAPR
jgi:MoxR-like ATPase